MLSFACEDVDTWEYRYMKKNARAKLRLLRELMVRHELPMTRPRDFECVTSGG